MISYFKTVFTSSWAFVKGLGITLRYMFKPAVTVQYPTEKLHPYPPFRGAPLFDAATCIARFFTNVLKSSFLATKSDSQSTSIRTPIFPPRWM